VEPQYAGGAPGKVAGVMQVNVQIPSGVQPSSAVPIDIQVGGVSSQLGVTIAISEYKRSTADRLRLILRGVWTGYDQN
jgi:hypothetical protein